MDYWSLTVYSVSSICGGELWLSWDSDINMVTAGTHDNNGPKIMTLTKVMQTVFLFRPTTPTLLWHKPNNIILPGPKALV